MGRNKFFAIIFTIAALCVVTVGCTCDECGPEVEHYELTPYEVKEYKLYDEQGFSTTVKVYKYDSDGQKITLHEYGSDYINVVFENKETDALEDESILNKGTYFDY